MRKTILLAMVTGALLTATLRAQVPASPPFDGPPDVHGPPPFPGGGPGMHRPRLSPEDMAMIALMTEDERITAFLKLRQDWLLTLSAERRAAYDAKLKELAEQKAKAAARHKEFLESMTPEQRAAFDARREEMDKVRQLTPEEQKAYFDKMREERRGRRSGL